MRNNKKGFTIVELVIVIAVIAILSAVLIPTFSGIIGNAQETARDQEARNLYTNYLTETTLEDPSATPVQDGYVVVDGHYYTLAGGQVTVDGDQPTEAPADLGTETPAGSGVYTKVVTP